MISDVVSLVILGTAYLCQFRTLEPVWANEQTGVIVCWDEGNKAPVLTFFGTVPTQEAHP